MEDVLFVNVHAHAPGEGVTLLDMGTGLFGGSSPGVFYSAGIHPVRLTESAPGDWEALDKALLREDVVAVGECGLDRRLPISLSAQEEAFLRQARLAETRGLPVIVHCVRAFPELVSLRRSGGFRMPWIVHGFNNNERILRMLLDCGFHISLGGALLNPSSNAFRVLPEIPLACLFLETDERPLPVRLVYEAASARLGVSLGELKRQMWINFNEVFLWKNG